MITEQLKAQISRMKEVYRLEQLKQNQAAQTRLNKRYTDACTSAHQTLATLTTLKARLGFSLKPETTSEIRDAVTQLEQAWNDGLPEAEQVNNAEQKLKNAQRNIRTQWKAYHAQITANPVHILHIAQSWDPVQCKALIQTLDAGSEWVNNPAGYDAFCQALEQSQDMIHSINADAEVLGFLERIHGGYATLRDLTPKVETWLRDQALTDKVYLSFGKA